MTLIATPVMFLGRGRVKGAAVDLAASRDERAIKAP
jgi:hypothetical protein